MSRTRVISLSSAALVAMLAGACGSASQPGQVSSKPTTPVTKKLNLAAGQRAEAPSDSGATGAIYPARVTTYVLDSTLPGLGSTAPVRRLKAHDVSAADVQRFADALGVVGTPKRTPIGWEVSGTNTILSFVTSDGTTEVSFSSGVPNVSGGSSGSTGAGAATPGSAVANAPSKVAPPPAPTVEPQPAPPVDVPSEAEAKTIARELLDRLGVLAGQEWTTTASDSDGVAVSCPVGVPCPYVPPEARTRTVAFSLLIDGSTVAGADWSVTIGEHRRVESLNGQWATPAALGDYPLRSTAAVFADLRDGKAMYAGVQPMTAMDLPAIKGPTPSTDRVAPTVPAVIVHVTGVALGIARWSAYDDGHPVFDLVPTYRFHARIDGGSPYDIEVLALDPSAINFGIPTPTPRPLPVEPAPAPDAAGTPASPPSS